MTNFPFIVIPQVISSDSSISMLSQELTVLQSDHKLALSTSKELRAALATALQQNEVSQCTPAE